MTRLVETIEGMVLVVARNAPLRKASASRLTGENAIGSNARPPRANRRPRTRQRNRTTRHRLINNRPTQ